MDIIQSTSQDALQGPELALSQSCHRGVSRRGLLRWTLKGSIPEAAVVSWRGGRLEENREGIQSSRGWGSKQHWERRRVQGVVKWASICHIWQQTNRTKEVLGRPSPKKVFHNALKMRNAAIFPNKSPSLKNVVNALAYTEQKAEIKYRFFSSALRVFWTTP